MIDLRKSEFHGAYETVSPSERDVHVAALLHPTAVDTTIPGVVITEPKIPAMVGD